MKRGCEKISRLASEGLERSLTWRENLSMRIHFLMCSACRYYAKNIAKLHQVLRLRSQQGSDELKLPKDKKEKIKHKLENIEA